MNLLDLLDNELEQNHLTKDEKIRYIYLRLCEIFSYDERYCLSKIFNDYNLKNTIDNRKVNLEDVTDLRITCQPFTNYVLSLLIEELVGAKTIRYNFGPHYYVITTFDKEEYILDATSEPDFASVKMGLETKGFKPINEFHTQSLKELDSQIGYHLLTKMELKDSLGELDYQKISVLLEQSKNKFNYTDAIYFIRKLSPNYGCTYFDIDYNIFRIIEDNGKYFILEKEKNKYRLKEISKEKVLFYKQKLTYKGE